MAEQEVVEFGEFVLGPLCAESGYLIKTNVKHSCVVRQVGRNHRQVHLGAADNVTGAYAHFVTIQCRSSGPGDQCKNKGQADSPPNAPLDGRGHF